MTAVYLVRHGQAQTGATTEDDYDQLSQLGHTQAAWLAKHLAGSNHRITRVVCGDLRRQRETAAYIADSLGLETTVDPRLRELDYFALAASMQARADTPIPNSRETFLEQFPQLMAGWAAGEIYCSTESFQEFEARVLAALEWAETHPGTVLVTSGGVIGMTIRHVLGLSLDAFSHVLLQIHNASLHQYHIEAGARRLVSFNGTPHLDAADRAGERTFI